MARGGNPIFGLTSGRGGGGRGRGRGRGGGSNTRFTGNRRGGYGGGGRGGAGGGKSAGSAPDRADDGSAQVERFEEIRVRDEIDEKLGFWKWEGGAGGVTGEGEKKVGWLVNMHQVRRLCDRTMGLCLGLLVC